MMITLIDQALQELRDAERFRLGDDADMTRYWQAYAAYMENVRKYIDVYGELTAVDDELLRSHSS